MTETILAAAVAIITAPLSALLRSVRIAALSCRWVSPDVVSDCDECVCDRCSVIEPYEWMKACPSFDVAAWLKEIGITQ